MAKKADKADQGSQQLEHAKKLYAQKDLRGSETEFRKLFDSEECQAESAYHLGLIRMSKKDYAAATEYFKKAIDLDPKNANAHFYLAELSSDEKKAHSFYQKALDIDPAHAGAKKRLQDPALRSTGKNGHPGFEYMLRHDDGLAARQIVTLLASLKRRVKPVRPRFRAYIDKFIQRVVILAMLVLGMAALTLPPRSPAPGTVPLPAAGLMLPALIGLALVVFLQPPKLRAWIPLQPSEVGFVRLFVLMAICILLIDKIENDFPNEALAVFTAILAGLYLAYYVLWIRNLRVSFSEGRLLLRRGVFGRQTQTVELYRVVDVELRQSGLNRWTGDGSIVLFVEGIHGSNAALPVELTGIARADELTKIFEELRNVVLLLRSSAWGKGIIN